MAIIVGAMIAGALGIGWVLYNIGLGVYGSHRWAFIVFILLSAVSFAAYRPSSGAISILSTAVSVALALYCALRVFRAFGPPQVRDGYCSKASTRQTQRCFWVLNPGA